MLLRLHVSLLLALLLSYGGRGQEQKQASKSETPLQSLQIETLVASPEGCTERSATGDTVAIHYTGTLEDGRIIDTSLSRDPLQVELGKRQVIPGLEQGLLNMCVGAKMGCSFQVTNKSTVCIQRYFSYLLVQTTVEKFWFFKYYNAAVNSIPY